MLPCKDTCQDAQEASCEYERQLDRFHDGELPDVQHQQVEAHVAGCPSCQRTLGAIRALSRQFHSADLPRMEAGEKDRLRQAVLLAGAGQQTRRGNRPNQWARWLTAAAAAVFLLSLSQVVLTHWRSTQTPTGVPVRQIKTDPPDMGHSGPTGDRPTPRDVVLPDDPSPRTGDVAPGALPDHH